MVESEEAERLELILAAVSRYMLHLLLGPCGKGSGRGEGGKGNTLH